MQRKKSSDSLVVNYHKHPEVGGMGHVSIQSTHNGEVESLSVYPKPSILSAPVATLTFFSFPTRAENKALSNDHPECSPIVASYEILNDIDNHEAAHNEIKKLNEGINSGKVGFSIIPSTVTRLFYALTSPHLNLFNIHTGMKHMDREIINQEINNADVTNCAHSVNQVLIAGGHKKANGIFGYPTPSGVNTLFSNHKPNMHGINSTKDRPLADVTNTLPRKSN